MPSFFLRTRRPPRSTLFPYPTLFRSDSGWLHPGSVAAKTLLRELEQSARSFTADRKSTRLNSSHGYISYALFFFKDTAPTEIYPLPLPDALPIGQRLAAPRQRGREDPAARAGAVRPVVHRRSEEHTSELQSRLHLLCPLFF